MKCYRVWFKDGSATLVDAESEDKAREIAERIALSQDWRHSVKARTAKTVECLSDEEVTNEVSTTRGTRV